MANRQLPTSASPGTLSGNTYLDSVNAEVSALWNYVRIPLTAIAGTANAITASLDPPLLASLVDGMSFLFTPVTLNNGATTISINGATGVALCDMAGTALNGGELIPGRTRELIFDGASGKFRVPLGPVPGVQTINTDTAFGLTVGFSKRNIRHTGTLTADRAVTLSAVGASDGDDFVITRSGGGAFNLIAAGKTLAASTWGRFVYDATAAAWYCAATSSL